MRLHLFVRLQVVLAIGLMVAGLCYAGTFNVAIEPAGVQSAAASIVCVGQANCIFGTETFDSLTGYTAPGLPPALPAGEHIYNFSTNFGGALTNYGSSPSISGTISGVYSSPQGTASFVPLKADQYGGAGGTGVYAEIYDTDPGRDPAGPNSYTVTLTSGGNIPGVNFFGLWFPALDNGSQLQFYSGSTLVYTFTPAAYIGLVGTCPNASNAYCGNPNPQFLQQNPGQQYAYIDFTETGGYFTSVVFTELNGYGGAFESDNQTAGYLGAGPSGIPEPGSLGLFMSGGILIALGAIRRVFRA